MSNFKILVLCFVLAISVIACAKDEDDKDVIITATNLPIKGTQSVPANQSTSTGTLTASFNKTTGVLNYTVSWNGLSGSHQGIHFHKAARGQNGPVVKNIQTSGSATGSLTESWSVPDSLHAKIENGGFYINLHTDSYPDGELRGQLEF